LKSAKAVTPGQSYWFQRHPRWTLFVVQVCSVLLALLLAEGAARLIFPKWVPDRQDRVNFWRYDALLGWSQTPNQEGRLNHPEFSVDIRINSLGLRDDEYPVERTAKRRMLVLGDSFGWGFGVEQEQRLTEIIEGLHPEWEIINASVSGYGTDQEFLYLR